MTERLGWSPPPRGPALLLLAHGSRDPRAAAATGALARAVAAARPWLAVRHAFLELSFPRALPVLRGLTAIGHREVVVAPLLLTAAYHSRVDVPAVLAEAANDSPGLTVRSAGALGPDSRLLDALTRRVSAGARFVMGPGFDAVALAAAGSSARDARLTVHRVAQALGDRWGVPAKAGFASAAAQPGASVAEAVSRLRASGAERVAVASYFLAPGLLHDRVVAAARGSGAAAVAPPLAAAPELVDVVLDRYDAVSARWDRHDKAPAGSTRDVDRKTDARAYPGPGVSSLACGFRRCEPAHADPRGA